MAGDYTATTGTVLTAANWNAYVRDQVITVCTSGTRPANVFEGKAIYETDTHKHLFYAGATDTWQQAWNQPWGYVGYAAATTSQSSITTVVDLTSVTLTATAVANRRWKITLKTQFTNSGVNGTTIQITDGSNTGISDSFSGYANGSSVAWGITCMAVVTTTAGSLTYKGRAAAAGGTAALSASATNPAFILIEDIGPNGAPS